MVALEHENKWWHHLLWVFGGAILGMLIAGVFAGILKLERNMFLIPYILLISVFLYSYKRWSGLDLKKIFFRHCGWGLLGGVVVGIFMVKSVLRQPSSPAPQGIDLFLNVLWPVLAAEKIRPKIAVVVLARS